MKYIRAWIAAALSAAAVVEFVFWGGAGIGITLLFLTLTGCYYIACGFPQGGKIRITEHIILLVMTTSLALTYSLFANQSLRVLNFPVLGLLLGVLFLHGSLGDKIAFDRPLFHAELFVSYFARPFLAISKPWTEAGELRKSAHTDPEAGEKRKKTKSVLLQVLLALLIAVPLLLLLTALLTASDPVFGNFLSPIVHLLTNFRFSTLFGKAIVFAFLLPFVASAVWSYRNKMTLIPITEPSASRPNFAATAVFSVTILALVDVLYLLYDAVQFLYLFGGMGGHLPENLTYAEYARNGFFELAFVSFINVGLLIISIKLTGRKGVIGIVTRILSCLLMLLASVQLISAFSRMNLYIEVYGLTILRYFVVAFMILLAVYFAALLVKEFVPAFPIFRVMFMGGVLALILLNFSMPDARIAQYNVDHYLSGEINQIDIDYISGNLSGDAKVYVLENKGALLDADPSLERDLDGMEDSMSDSRVSISPQFWKFANLSDENTQNYLDKE